MDRFPDERGQDLHGPHPRPLPEGRAPAHGLHHGHWKTTTFVGALTMRGMIAPFVLPGAINRDAVSALVEKVLVPEPRPGDIVVVDNLFSHKGPRARAMIEAAGTSLLSLPPCSPDFNPIKNAFAKLKALLRRTAERTVDGVWAAIGRIAAAFTPTECANEFSAPGYDPDWYDSALAQPQVARG